MATQFTNYTKDGLLNHFYGGTTWSNAGRSSITLGLHTSDPGAAGSGAGFLSGIGMSPAVSFGAATADGIANDAVVTFSTTGSGDDGATVTHIAVYGSDGQMLAYGEAATQDSSPLVVSEGTDIEIPVGGLAIGVDTNSLEFPQDADFAIPDAKVVEFLEFVFGLGSITPTVGPFYLCYVDTFAADGSGAAWAGMNELVTFGSVSNGSGDARKISSSNAQVFVTTQGQTLGMWVLKDANSNPIALKKLSGASVVSGATVTLAAGDLEISID